jgi:cytochrome c oxidase accessory protein FixG
MHTVIARRKSRSDGAEQPVSAAERVRAKDRRGGLYKPRTPIYPKLVHGQWRAIKWALLVLTLSIYYVTPWLRWERPGDLPDQAVLIDFTGRRFYFFWIQLWPQEVHFITGLLVIAALALFLSNALFGRLWCGYACPQTVWTDLFIYVERLFEGDRNQRMRLAAAPWSLDKLWRRTGKHLVWLGVAFGTGGAWIFYFHDAPDLLVKFWTGRAPIGSYVSCALLTGTTYLFAGHMREQVCIYMCPWPRIQGAMLDPHSLQVTYRYDRGEPRGAHKKGESWEGRGGCVDCNQCVVVCPMGIDIRNGPQLECINCGLCADACDEIMRKLDRPVGLIGYDTDAAVAARASGRPTEYRLVRPRTLYYAAGLLLAAGLTTWGLVTRESLELHALPDRNPGFVRLADGSIRNGYTLKIANRAFEPQRVRLVFDGVRGARIKTPEKHDAVTALDVTAPPNAVKSVRVFVIAPPSDERGPTPARFIARADEEQFAARTTFQAGN